jgi:hypothetical protein
VIFRAIDRIFCDFVFNVFESRLAFRRQVCTSGWEFCDLTDLWFVLAAFVAQFDGYDLVYILVPLIYGKKYSELEFNVECGNSIFL